MDFKNVPKKYRPIPFWSWNERLDTAETDEQIRIMDKAGIGGFFMHARGGLQTEYMQDEWFENVSTAVKTAEELGMRAWAYDENGWPSGFGNGKVNGLGVEYQQKYLRAESTLTHADTAICKCGSHYFYYEINPFYVDVLDEKVIADFIKVAYAPYYEKCANSIEGFFTDEPQISRKGIPWSFVFEKEFSERYGMNICEHLEELFYPVGDYENIRIKFWKMVTDLFSKSFMKQICDFCNERGLKLTGHLLGEETLFTQLTSNGACMPHYEYMDIPGMDWLGRKITPCLAPIQVSSVAQQLGKKQVLSETFALCGHNVSFAELKGIYEWQMVHGINLMCQHLEGYSLRGIRKRDYPPAMYKQQPWWSEYDKWVDAMSRVSMLLADGDVKADVLLIHPQTTAWAMYCSSETPALDKFDNNEIAKLHDDFMKTIELLESKHIPYHLGDETIMERHGRVENGKLVIGNQAYSYVIKDNCRFLFDTTQALLDDFKSQGGKILSAEEILPNNAVDNPKITYTARYYPDFTVHYFVNTSPDKTEASFNVNGKILDIYSGYLSAFSGSHSFEPWGSLVLIDAGAENIAPVKSGELVRPNGEFEVLASENAITLDKCDYWFDGVLQEKNGYVLNIAERAIALKKPVRIRQEYHVKIEHIPSSLYLVCETPQNFEISVNGKKADSKPNGFFVDKSFKKIEISELLVLGENTIVFECDFAQSQKVYENWKKSFEFETEKNKLVYDMEIEPVYLVGDFSVKTNGNWSALEHNASRYNGDFIIEKPKKTVDISHIEMQGFPFFAGELTLKGKIEIPSSDAVLKLNMLGMNAVRVKISDVEKTMLTSTELPLKDFGVIGKCDVTFTVINNLRNLMGPHHLAEGECCHVSPASFYKESCVWNFNNQREWNDDYCFVTMSL